MLLGLLVGGCVTQAPGPAPVAPAATVRVAEGEPAVIEWIDLQQEVLTMQDSAIEEELEQIGEAPTTGEELYYFGLLNQQMKDYDRWITARDAFRQVSKDPELDLEQRQLAGIFERYNQTRINWYSKQSELLEQYRELELELDALDDEKALLQQKIQALTDLEAVISTRKEQ